MGNTTLEQIFRNRWQIVERARRMRRLAWGKLRDNRTSGTDVRRAFMILARPEWVDRQAIRAIYVQARLRNQEDGPNSWHVDHIVPINHPEVCGLHVPWNLRIITSRENCQKHNMFDEELALTAGTNYAPDP